MLILQQNIQDSLWQPNLSHSYDLSIVVAVHSLLYSISDAQQRLLLVRSYQIQNKANATPDEIWAALQAQDGCLSMTFAKVFVSYQSPYLVLLPDELYLSEQSDLYLKHSFADFVAAQYFVAATDLLDDKKAVFALPLAWHNCLQQQYPEATPQHCTAEWLYYIMQQRTAETHTVYAHVQERQLQIAVCGRAEKLLFFNQYEFFAASDFLYYILLAYQNLGLDTATIALKLSGELLTASEIYELLQKYVQNVEFLPPPAWLTLSPTFDGLPMQIFADSFLSKHLT
jgi:hypothetical protein